MKLVIIGSRNAIIENLEEFIDFEVEEIVAGGACGVDASAITYASANNIQLTVFLPDYKRYKKGAPFKRNQQIAEYADVYLAVWNGTSKGTMHTVSCFKKLGKPVIIKYIKYLFLFVSSNFSIEYSSNKNNINVIS